MIHVELLDLLNTSELVVYKYLEIDVAQQIKINLIPVISDSHNERTVLIKKVDLL